MRGHDDPAPRRDGPAGPGRKQRIEVEVGPSKPEWRDVVSQILVDVADVLAPGAAHAGELTAPVAPPGDSDAVRDAVEAALLGPDPNPSGWVERVKPLPQARGERR